MPGFNPQLRSAQPPEIPAGVSPFTGADDIPEGASPFAVSSNGASPADIPQGVSPFSGAPSGQDIAPGTSPFASAPAPEPNWWERTGIAQPGSPLAEKGFGGMVADWPAEIVDYFRNTPSALEQSAENWRRVQEAGGPFTEEGMRLSLEDPMLYSFTPGEGLVRGFGRTPPRDILNARGTPRAETPPGRAAESTGAQVPPAATQVAPTPRVANVESPGAVGESVSPAGPAGVPDLPPMTEQLSARPDPILLPSRGAAEPIRPPASGKAGNINLSRIDSPEAIKNVIRQDAELSGGDITARRGVIPLEVTAEMARDLGMTPGDLAKRMHGQAFNAEQAVAARNLLATSADHVYQLSQSIRERASQGLSTDADMAAFSEALTRHRAIQEQVSGMTAEAGRALSSFRLMATVPDRAFALKRILENGGGREKLEQMAADIATLPPEAIGQYVKNAAKATLYDKLYYIRINALVSGWKTHVANILGNTATALWSLPETAVAAGISRLTRSGRAEGVMFHEVPRMITGMAQGTLEGFAAGGRAIRTGETRGGMSKLELQNQTPIGGVAGKVIGFPTRLLAAEDELFKSVAYRAKINAEAIRVARAQGYKGDALFKQADELRRNPTDAMIESAEKHAKYQTFQSDMGAIAKWFSQARNVPGLRYVAMVALPFIRTPANIFKYSMERSPLGFVLREVRENFAGKNGPAARDTQIARMALGTALEATVGLLVAQGVITGAGPVKDPQRLALMRANGWQPYSIQIGGRWFSYNRLDPLGMMMGMAADVVELGSAVTDADADRIGAIIGTSITQNFINKSYMQGVQQLSAMINDPGRYGEGYIRNFLGSLVPAGVAHVATALDPVVRDTRGTLDAIRARVPYLTESLPAKLNIFGERITREQAGPDIASPIATSTPRNDPVINEMLRLGYTPSMPDRKIMGVDLSPELYWEYVARAGRPAKAELDRMVASPGWNRLSDLQKAERLKVTINGMREKAAAEMMRAHPELRNAILESVRTQR